MNPQHTSLDAYMLQAALSAASTANSTFVLPRMESTTLIKEVQVLHRGLSTSNGASKRLKLDSLENECSILEIVSE